MYSLVTVVNNGVQYSVFAKKLSLQEKNSDCMWSWVLTEPIMVIILQYIRKSNQYIIHPKTRLYVNYISIKRNRI